MNSIVESMKPMLGVRYGTWTFGGTREKKDGGDDIG